MDRFSDSLVTKFAAFGPVGVRKMFGGYGVYYQGLMFGLVADDAIYLKADRQSLPLFTEAGCSQFVYTRQNRPIGMSYYSAPEIMFRNDATVLYWSSHAYEAALRAQALKNTKKRKSPLNFLPRV